MKQTKTKTKKGMVGITTDPWRLQGPLLRAFPKMKNWHEAGPFLGVEAGTKWENGQKRRGYAVIKDPDHINLDGEWYGYRFDL